MPDETKHAVSSEKLLASLASGRTRASRAMCGRGIGPGAISGGVNEAASVCVAGLAGVGRSVCAPWGARSDAASVRSAVEPGVCRMSGADGDAGSYRHSHDADRMLERTRGAAEHGRAAGHAVPSR